MKIKSTQIGDLSNGDFISWSFDKEQTWEHGIFRGVIGTQLLIEKVNGDMIKRDMDCVIHKLHEDDWKIVQMFERHKKARDITTKYYGIRNMNTGEFVGFYCKDGKFVLDPSHFTNNVWLVKSYGEALNVLRRDKKWYKISDGFNAPQHELTIKEYEVKEVEI